MKRFTQTGADQRHSVLSAALGKTDCDLIIRQAKVLDVFHCEWMTADVAIHNGIIVGLGTRQDSRLNLKAKRIIEAKNRYLVPGFIDAHVHIESSLLTPAHFQAAVLPKGTTSAICDPHELANVLGLPGIQFFLDTAVQLDLNLKVMMSSCVPATSFETNGGGTLSAQDLKKLASHSNALGLAEVMNVPGILNGDPDLLEKLDQFAGKPIDGHAPLVRGCALSAYAAMGITSCHESSEFSEAQEKLQKGMQVWIREGSVAKDLSTLSPLLTTATSTSIGFCTDDRNPLDIAHEGHLDFLIRSAIHQGVDPCVAYRSASWSVARHYGLDRIQNQYGPRIGAIAPGYLADLVLLRDDRTCDIEQVFKAGVEVDQLPTATASGVSSADPVMNSIQAHIPEAADLVGPSGKVHVIGVIEGKLITEKRVMQHQDTGVARMTVLERYGRGSKPMNAYVYGFGDQFRGAIASSVGHDSHNLAVVGSNEHDMRTALAAIIESQGGFCVVQNGSVIAHLALPFGGLISRESPESIAQSLLKLRDASKQAGCILSEPFLQLAFLCLPVIPSLKLTDRGLIDVDQFKIIPVCAN
jgi:adenine deaminase